ncbi:hypothetical protein PHLCEN_2v11210 [Hermanssonia centrifuga]|uniref:Mitochondrial carrier protein n=1 Tax=Hermanssonia centrifuga TaxID=98765 RepID=A0A2R6NKL8_9APHY|nr:hypothetical protein PHLCEN_2v11210 [Hermanssonia centrifuga]
MATSPYFASVRAQSSNNHGSTLPKLTSQGNLLAGATARVTVGLILNPFSVLKARYEVRFIALNPIPIFCMCLTPLPRVMQSNLYAYPSFSNAFGSLIRAGPSELFRGFLPSALRDAPYAGLFIVFYEGIKQETARLFPSASTAHTAGVHSFSAATAGAIATMATHPFDLVKVGFPGDLCSSYKA